MSTDQSDSPKPERKRKRRWLQFSLRTMLLFVVAFSLFMGLVGTKLKRLHDQQRAAEAILELGGSVSYDYMTPSGNDEPPGPKWLRDLLGENFFAHATEVLYPPGIGDEDLAHLDGMPDLTRLGLDGAMVTDAGLAHLWAHGSLATLYLRSTPITDAHMPKLAQLRALEGLDLAHTAITDKAVPYLTGLPRLEWIELQGTHVTPRAAEPLGEALLGGLAFGVSAPAPSEKQRTLAVALERRGAWVGAYRRIDRTSGEYLVALASPRIDNQVLALLESLESLRVLVLDDTLPTRAQWARIAGSEQHSTDGARAGEAEAEGRRGLKRLEGLILKNVPITDNDMVYIARLTNLQVLSLHSTTVTDAGLRHLSSLQNLAELDLDGACVSDAALAHVGKLANLQTLDLVGPITDAGLVHVAALKKLEELRLSNAQVTDAGLVHLNGLMCLEYLYLSGSQISDAGLPHLVALTNLDSLFLANTQISDTGLEHLKSLDNLRYLDVDGTEVSPEALWDIEEQIRRRGPRPEDE